MPFITEVYKIKGMHCASCSILINKMLMREKGVHNVNANYGSEKLILDYDPRQLSLEKISAVLKKIGYTLILTKDKAAAEEESEKAKQAEILSLKYRAISSLILAAPIIFYYMMVHMFNLPHSDELCFGGAGFNFWSDFLQSGSDCNGVSFDLNWVYLVLATPIQFVIGWPFYRNSWTAIRAGAASMDTLVALGTSAAYFYSVAGFLFSFAFDRGWQSFWIGDGHPFWESSAALLSFIVLGRYFEALTRGRASEAIRKLLKLSPPQATVVRDGKEVKIPLSEMLVGDVFLVKPGEKIATDGVVIEGETSVDEKVVTGESLPIGKKPSSQVIGATLNTYGFLKCRATKVGRETLLYQIVQLVEEAQASRAPIQDVADRISEYFVPSVIIISLATFSFWFFVQGFTFAPAFISAIAVLVVSCPCALGLATPTAIMVGAARGAESGILIKGGEALEKAKHITTVAFDKTGTLTKGEPAVTDIIVLSDLDEREILRIAAGAEKGSEHPLAKAVVKTAQDKNLVLPDLKNFKAVSGKGIQAVIENKLILVGNEVLLTDAGIDISPYESKFEDLQNQAKTVVFVSCDGRPVGLLALADTLKDYAKEAVAELKKIGKEVLMITGDNERTAKAIAEQLGMTSYFAKILPENKEKLIEKLQKEGKKVAMVGDGINDAPALAKSNLGIAVGSGTDVAIETGEIILIKDDLRDVVTAIDLSRRTLRKVWQNFFWAFIYNIIAIPVAARLHLFITQTGADPADWILTVSQGIKDIIPLIGPGLGTMFYNLSQSSLRPEIAGFAMAFSSVSVVTNSLLLRLYKEPKFAREVKK